MEDPEKHGRRAGILLGIGLGGFVDGIVLHQVLQWHHMLSTVLPPTDLPAMRENMLADGLFHGFTWVVTAAGVLFLWRAARRGRIRLPGRWFAGLLLAGWGLFNLIEGLVNHQLLGIHHVRRYGPEPLWDYGFLLSGIVLVLVGYALARSGGRSTPA